MKRYQCIKSVEAVKIVDVQPSGESYVLIHRDGQIAVSEGWVERHDPKAGGYYVRYADGYTSYSPAEAFEEGYVDADAINGLAWDALVAYGVKANPSSVQNGMAWHFTIGPYVFTHENDNCYVVSDRQGRSFLVRPDNITKFTPSLSVEASGATGGMVPLSDNDKSTLLRAIRDWSPALNPEYGYMISPEGAIVAVEKWLEARQGGQ